MRPNVMLIVLDTARADAFEPYGAPTGASPTLSDVARNGGHTELAYATGSWTLPSHVSMFTGRLPRAAGLGQAPDGNYRGTRARMEQLHPDLLSTVLRDAGYRTVGASCNAWISPTGGWDLGFDEFCFVPSPRGHPRRRRSPEMARWLWHSTVADVDDGARATEEVVRDWFARWDGRDPFFWFLNVVECHSPYLPPAPYNDLPLVQRLLAVRDAQQYQSFLPVLRQNLTGVAASPTALARMRHLYARSIRLLDDWVGRLVDLLDARGVLDDTILMVTSDHGENFGEGGLLGHSMSLDERLIRVPFVTRGPVAAPAGPWSTMGLPALVGDAVGIPHPWDPVEEGGPVAAQFDPLAAPGDAKVAQLADDWGLDARAVRMLTQALTCVTDGRHKVVQFGEQRWAHDLRADPLEAVHRAVEEAPAALLAALEDPQLWRTDAEAEAGDDHVATADPDEVARLEEQMRLLGYM